MPRSSPEQNPLIQVLADNFLYQTVTVPTRMRPGQNPSTLDLVITKDPEKVIRTQTLSPIGSSDHMPVLSSIQLNSKPSKYTKQFFTNYKMMVEELLDANPETLISDDVEASWLILKNTLLKSQAIILAKKKLWEKFVKQKTTTVYEKHKIARNLFRKETWKLTVNYDENLAKNVKENPKLLWKHISLCKPSRHSVPDLENNSSVSSCASEKANLLNQQFASVFSKDDLQSTLPPAEQAHTLLPMLHSPITLKEVTKQLKELDANKSTGHDGLSPRLLSKKMVTLSCNKNEMVKTLKLIGNEEEYTDVNIIAEGSSVPCHRAILSAVSPFFKKLFNDIPPWEKDLSISLAETSFEDLKLALTLLYKGEIFISMSHSLKVMELVNFLDLPCFKKSKIEVLPYLPPDSDSVDLELPNLSESNSAEKEKNKKIFNPKIVLQKTNNEFIQETGAAIWRCEICGKAHNSWLLLSLHKDTQCGTKVPSICVECQSKIKSYPEFVLHNVEHKVSEQKMCPICLSINVDNIEQHLVSSGHVAPDMFQAPSPMTSSHLKSTGYPSKRKKPLLRPKSKQVLYSELFTSSSDEEKMSEP
ncbi:hypothetical protein QYM36_011254, partial [Artemia franciscana]